jgi:GNAT superfamily N-acetyltransferase
MTGNAEPQRIVMVRSDLEHLPEFAWPEGFSLRWYQPGDEDLWIRIHLATERLRSITPELFFQQFGSDPQLLAERQCYLCAADGTAAGTSTAWFDDGFQGQRYGRVHWVAVLPEFQGRGLGKSLVNLTCRRLRELGHERAYLATSALRLQAIGLYLQFGFVPLIRSDAEAALWHRIRANISAC